MPGNNMWEISFLFARVSLLHAEQLKTFFNLKSSYGFHKYAYQIW